MGTLAGILATLAVSHLGGSALGGVLARFGLLGFGRKLRIAVSVRCDYLWLVIFLRRARRVFVFAWRAACSV